MDEAYFWLHVDWKGKTKDECWEYKGYIGTNGYGQHNYKICFTRDAHIIAYKLKRGHIPKGLCVLHKCDNRKCCRPKHLFLGTRLDNAKDRNNKGRTKHGEELSQRKLNKKQVEEIRELAYGQTQRSIAVLYGVSFQQISRIVRGENWR